MKKIRIIPRLDIKGPNVVKGIHMEGLKVIGHPPEIAKRYYNAGADEMLYMDIVASLYGRGIDVGLVKSVAREIFIPLTVGGGIQSIHDINNVLHAGADKVAINTFAVRHPEMLKDAVRQFGSQCIVLSIEAKKSPEGTWEVYTDGGREHTGLEVMEWTKKALSFGIGEILITSVDNDGTRKGYDNALIQEIESISPIPVIACGGAGSMDSVKSALQKNKIDGIAMATVLHYDEYSIHDLKKYLHNANFPMRI
ncbi:MAG: imidazole glycerol phosphate synthase cyclase subunit [Kiritimatiellales bacterium]|nr:imidazole glycerol phosphate synthase cyclase subunit [Kiritimatiellales bacterium]